MRAVAIVLAGWGKVGRAFYNLLGEKRERLHSCYDLDLRLKAVLTSRGGVVVSGDIGTGGLDTLARKAPWDPALELHSLLERNEPGVLVECTASNIKTGQPALDLIRKAIGAGWHVAVASKGPLAVDLRGLNAAAGERGVKLLYSAAAGAALPTLDVGLRSLAGAEVLEFEGILNGTTNYILGRMEEGLEYAEALREAQARGIAEPDPSMDVLGWDSAAKLLIIANTILESCYSLDEISVEGITHIPGPRLRQARDEGKKVKLLAGLRRQGGRLVLTVGPATIDESHPLYDVDGTNKGIVFVTDTMGTIAVLGGRSDPRGAAAALLKDILAIYLR